MVSEPFLFHIYFTSLCNSLCSLSLTSLYICFYSGESSQRLIRLFFTVSLHVSLSISAFASTSACAKGQHCFTSTRSIPQKVYRCIERQREWWIDWPMRYRIQWINTASKLQVSTGIFYLLISRNILDRNFIWKKHHVNHPTLSEPFFFHISVTSLCNSLCSLSLTSLYIRFAQANPHND